MLQSDFQEALRERIPRPFVFGPIEFSDLDREECQNLGEQWRAAVIDQLLQKANLFGFPAEDLCIHGFKVAIKGKTLKRATTILKHARFMRNLIVSPLMQLAKVHAVTGAVENTQPEEGQEEAA